MNSNGEHLLDTLPESNTIRTNTCFPHKLAHRTIVHALYVVHVLHQIEILVMILMVNVGRTLIGTKFTILLRKSLRIVLLKIHISIAES